MGFSDYFIQTVTAAEPNKVDSTKKTSSSTTNNNTDKLNETDGSKEQAQKSDQEILESIEEIYYQPESNAQMYELEVCIKHESLCCFSFCAWLSGWKVRGESRFVY